MATDPKKQQDKVEDYSETEHHGEDNESIVHYGSFREERGTVEENQDIYNEFAFERSPFHFGPIYEESTHRENVTSENSIPLHEKHLSTDNNRVEEDIMDDSDGNSLQTQPEEQEHSIGNYSETERDGDGPDSIGHYESLRNEERMVDDGYTGSQGETEYNGDELESISNPEKQRVNIDSQRETEHYWDEFQYNSKPEKQNGYTGSLSETEHSEHELESISQLGKQDGNTDNSEREHNFESFSQTGTEKQEDNIDNQSEAKHSGIELESTDQYGPGTYEERMVGEGKDGGTIMDDTRQSLEAQPQTREPYNYTQHNGIEFEAISQHGAVTDGERMVGGGEDGYRDTIRLGDEKHDGMENEKVDVLEALREEQDNEIVNNSETEHEEYELESIVRYQGSAREGRGIVAKDEDFHNEFSFGDRPFYVRPIYTDSTYLEVKAPENLVSFHEKHISTDNKKADDDLRDGYKTKSLETPPEEQKDNVDAEQNGIDFASVGYYGSVRNGERLVWNGEYGHTGTARRENETHHRMDNEKEDILATPREEHEDKIVNNSETEYDEYKLESIDRYQGLAREVRGVAEEEGDVYSEFPFAHPPFYVRPIYADITYLEETTPEHAVPLHEERFSTDNKRADHVIYDNKPVENKRKSMGTQPEEQENNVGTEHDGIESESISHYVSVRNGERIVEDEGVHTDSTRREDEKHLTMDNTKDALETTHLEQENKTLNNNETEDDGYELGSIGRYQRSARVAQGVAEKEDVHSEFPFEHYPFYVRPIDWDSTFVEEKTPEHPAPLNGKHIQTDCKRGDDGIIEGKSYAHKTKSPEEQENNTDTGHNVKEFEPIGHYESVGNDLVEDNEDVYGDFTSREDEKVESETMERPDAPNENSLEAQPEGQVDNIVKNSETKHKEDEFESIGRYHGSARKVRSMVEEVEDVYEEFPFDQQSFDVRPIYTDSMYLKAPEHLVRLHEQDLGVDKRNTFSNADQAGSRIHRRRSRDNHENADHKAKTTSGETNTSQGSKNDINEEGRVFPEDIYSFGDTNNVIRLTTRYGVNERDVLKENEGNFWNENMKTEKSIEFDRDTKGNEDKGVPGNGYKMPRNHEKYLVSHDEDNLQGVPVASYWDKDDQDNFQTSADREEARSSEKDERDEDEFLESGDHLEATDLHHDDEDDFQASGGDLERAAEDSLSERDEDHQDDFLGSADEFEQIEAPALHHDDEGDFQASGGDLEKAAEDSELERDEKHEDDFLGSADEFEQIEAPDWKYDEEEIETSGGDLAETAPEWDEDDEEGFQASGVDARINADAAYDANDRGNYDFIE